MNFTDEMLEENWLTQGRMNRNSVFMTQVTGSKASTRNSHYSARHGVVSTFFSDM